MEIFNNLKNKQMKAIEIGVLMSQKEYNESLTEGFLPSGKETEFVHEPYELVNEKLMVSDVSEAYPALSNNKYHIVKTAKGIFQVPAKFFPPVKGKGNKFGVPKTGMLTKPQNSYAWVAEY